MRVIRLLANVVVIASVASVVSARAQQVPARDQPAGAPSRTGTAVLAGRIVSDGTPAEPIRRAVVSISDQVGAGYGARLAVTGDDGRFEVRGLPAGRYFVTATKGAYVPAAYGLTRPVRVGAAVTGTAIPLAEGQRVTDVTLHMTRGSVVTGVVRSDDGRPIRGAVVRLGYLRRTASGERGLVGAPVGQSLTDSQGAYRIFGLTPGEYVVIAGLTGRDEARDAEITTDADVRRAATRPGALAAPATSTPPVRRPTVSYVPVYYPGTVSAADAQPIMLAAGEERGGIDLQLQRVPDSRVEGVVTATDGRPAAGVRVWLTSSTTGGGGVVATRTSVTDPQGTFRFAGVPAASYAIEVRPTPGGRGSGDMLAWGRTDVAVIGGTDARVGVQLQPGITLSGRLVFEPGGAKPPADLSRARVTLAVESGTAGAVATVRPDGQIVVAGVMPGRYRIGATLPGDPGQTWFLKSAVIAGRDVVDAGVRIEKADDSLVVTLSDRASEIAGSMVDSEGRPAPEYFVIVYPADRALWTWASRRIQQTRPGRDGTFSFRNLPAGAYLIAAVTDVEQNEWFEPVFLEALVGASVPVTLADAERKIQNLRIK